MPIAHHAHDQIKRNHPQIVALIFSYYVYSCLLPSPYVVSCWSPPREHASWSCLLEAAAAAMTARRRRRRNLDTRASRLFQGITKNQHTYPKNKKQKVLASYFSSRTDPLTPIIHIRDVLVRKYARTTSRHAQTHSGFGVACS